MNDNCFTNSPAGLFAFLIFYGLVASTAVADSVAVIPSAAANPSSAVSPSSAGASTSDETALGIWHQSPEPDQSDWSGKRRSGYARSLQVDMGPPKAVLVFPTLDLSVPVFADTERMSLERGAGWVVGTAEPGTPGNVAIAGHRDGYFRALERLPVDAVFELRMPDGSRSYQVSDITVVDPLDTTVLQDTGEDVVTLITCFPFRYQGYAPDRYIIRATLRQPLPQQAGLSQPVIPVSDARPR